MLQMKIIMVLSMSPLLKAVISTTSQIEEDQIKRVPLISCVSLFATILQVDLFGIGFLCRQENRNLEFFWDFISTNLLK